MKCLFQIVDCNNPEKDVYEDVVNKFTHETNTNIEMYEMIKKVKHQSKEKGYETEVKIID